MPEKKRIAIIGGGIAGLYTAWRLITSESDYDVTLYECSERLGGRILSQFLPPLTFRAELGAMRFHPMTHHLLRALIDDLEIPVRPFDVAPPHLYVRGRALSPEEILRGHCMRCRAGAPFQLRTEERGQSPDELLIGVVKSLFHDITFLDTTHERAHEMKERLIEGKYGADVWSFLREHGAYDDIPLREIGFWNLMQHYLSNEAHQLVYHALSLESVIGNWNAAEAIPWFISDFTGSDLWMVPGGMSRIVERMAPALEGHWEKNSRVVSCEEISAHKWKIAIDGNDKDQGIFDHVVLAVPLKSYETIKITPIGKPQPQPPWLRNIEAHRLFKVFLVYANPWWIADDVPGSATGRAYTDLPLRQVYYLDSKWMDKCVRMARQEKEYVSTGEERRWLEYEKQFPVTPNHRWSLVMASYSDEHHVNFWHPSSGRGDRPGGDAHFHPPHGLTSDQRKALQAEIERIPAGLRVGVRTVRKIQQQLREIHGHDVEEPIAGIYKDWGDERESFGGGWHTWLVGSSADDYHTTDRPDGLHFCGEVFSRDQGWIEGALRTAEFVLRRLGVAAGARANRYVDLDFDDYVSFKKDQRSIKN